MGSYFTRITSVHERAGLVLDAELGHRENSVYMLEAATFRTVFGFVLLQGLRNAANDLRPASNASRFDQHALADFDEIALEREHLRNGSHTRCCCSERLLSCEDSHRTTPDQLAQLEDEARN
jgi:hypothetical protein